MMGKAQCVYSNRDIRCYPSILANRLDFQANNFFDLLDTVTVGLASIPPITNRPPDSAVKLAKNLSAFGPLFERHILRRRHVKNSVAIGAVRLSPGDVKANPKHEQKKRLAERITQDVMAVLNYGDESVSVAMEEVKSQDWAKNVYTPDIKNKWGQLYKKPGYNENDL